MRRIDWGKVRAYMHSLEMHDEEYGDELSVWDLDDDRELVHLGCAWRDEKPRWVVRIAPRMSEQGVIAKGQLEPYSSHIYCGCPEEIRLNCVFAKDEVVQIIQMICESDRLTSPYSAIALSIAIQF